MKLKKKEIRKEIDAKRNEKQKFWLSNEMKFDSDEVRTKISEIDVLTKISK